MFLGQFRSPLIYVLMAAALVSLLIREWTGAGFIFAVLLLDAGIGSYQEYSAEQAAQALQSLVVLRAHVIRGEGTSGKSMPANSCPVMSYCSNPGRRFPPICGYWTVTI